MENQIQIKTFEENMMLMKDWKQTADYVKNAEILTKCDNWYVLFYRPEDNCWCIVSVSEEACWCNDPDCFLPERVCTSRITAVHGRFKEQVYSSARWGGYDV